MALVPNPLFSTLRYAQAKAFELAGISITYKSAEDGTLKTVDTANSMIKFIDVREFFSSGGQVHCTTQAARKPYNEIGGE